MTGRGARRRRESASWAGRAAGGGLALAALVGSAAWPAMALGAPAPRGGAAAGAGADELLSRPLALVVALALVSLLPFFLMVTTSFVKASTTLQIVRSALGAQGVPSNAVVMAFAAALSLMAMAPVVDAIGERARPLWQAERAPDTPALVAGIVEAVREPMRAFLRANASPQERARFAEVARRARPEAERGRVGDDDLVVLVPAFLTTELYEAFLLGFAVFLPFLVVDLVVANVLLALGMQQLQPTQVSLPFKLFLFVAVDGWGLLAQALVAGYKAG